MLKTFFSCILGIFVLISFVWLPANSLALTQINTPSTTSLGVASSIQDLFPNKVVNNATVITTENGAISQEDVASLGLKETATGILNRETGQEEATTQQIQKEKGLETVNNLADRQLNEALQRELGAEAKTIAGDVNPPFDSCDTSGKLWDAAISIIKGKVSLNKVINDLNGENKIIIELITDVNPEEQSLLLLNNDNPFLKGRILVGEEPKQDAFNYHIDQVDTICHQASLKDETNIIKSNRKEPAVLPSPATRLNPVFAKCDSTTDFAKYRIIGKSAQLGRVNSDDGTVNLTVKIFVDLNPLEGSDSATYTIPDDNRAVAARLIVDEGARNKEKVLDFILNKITTDCNQLDFLGKPTNIASDKIVNPLHGFENS